MDHQMLDVFSASVVSRLHCVLCRLWFIFHHLRKKEVEGGVPGLEVEALLEFTNLDENSPLKHLVFEESELGKQELGKLEVGKPGVDKQEMEENQEVKFDLTSSEDDRCKNEHHHKLHNFPRLLSREHEIGFDFSCQEVMLSLYL
uniref:Uncharacterized protein n=1 Tax=Tanacetum cinerariifolium TaxID=118510 RepID=A0A699GTB9_TANCI|nr:hypothetical protein [Tanacetum cinerariifolium]